MVQFLLFLCRYYVAATSNRALVGFSPRMHAHDIVSGALRYLKWQHTWWNGAYSIMLTKAAVLHKDYLLDFSKVLPAEVLQHVDKMRNCEDIAMAYVVAEKVCMIIFIDFLFAPLCCDKD